MPKLVICSVGTSIANVLHQHLRELQKKNESWECPGSALKKEIMGRLPKDLIGDHIVSMSAEMNSLCRIGLKSQDRVVLLATDSLLGKVCSEVLKECIQKAFSLDEASVDIVRVEGLQVTDEKKLRELGLKNLVKRLLAYLDDDNYRYRYDIIINPTGGFKGIVPFLTIAGMLFGRKSVYVFEFSNQLVTLPPLPISFDLDAYNRARKALRCLEDEVALPEQAYLNQICGFVPEERDFFMAFVEPLDESGQVTLSPLAFCLLKIDEKDHFCWISEKVVSLFKGASPTAKEKIARLLDNVADPLWRHSHIHSFAGTDLIVLKPGATAERLAGFGKNGQFYVALMYLDHNDYERDLARHSRNSTEGMNFEKWKSGGIVAE